MPTSNVDEMFQIDVDDFYGTGDSRQEMEVTATGIPDGYAFADPAERRVFSVSRDVEMQDPDMPLYEENEVMMDFDEEPEVLQAMAQP